MDLVTSCFCSCSRRHLSTCDPIVQLPQTLFQLGSSPDEFRATKIAKIAKIDTKSVVTNFRGDDWPITPCKASKFKSIDYFLTPDFGIIIQSSIFWDKNLKFINDQRKQTRQQWNGSMKFWLGLLRDNNTKECGGAVTRQSESPWNGCIRRH